MPIFRKIHRKTRIPFGLEWIPSDGGVQCLLCANQCTIPLNKTGFCGLRTNISGKLKHIGGTPEKGILDWYFDPLPTNCVADPFCSGHNKYGFKNLAVFYRSCTMNCLFCQNWHFRDTELTSFKPMSAQELASVADRRTHCICFFGGDPASQWTHALKTGAILKERGIAVCFETNGTVNTRLLKAGLKLALGSGGTIKFDLKAYTNWINIALTGVSNDQTLENFKVAAEWFKKRPEPPLVVASTLLVPGYIDEYEIERIASFIVSLDSRIPYVLLGFYPAFYMSDLQPTSRKFAEKAYKIAKEMGLKRVRIGNPHVLI